MTTMKIMAADPNAPKRIPELPEYWDQRRAREGKTDLSRCAAELRVALVTELHQDLQRLAADPGAPLPLDPSAPLKDRLEGLHARALAGDRHALTALVRYSELIHGITRVSLAMGLEDSPAYKAIVYLVQSLDQAADNALQYELFARREIAAATERETKLAALRAGLEEGERSPVAEGYSLERVLAKLGKDDDQEQSR